MACVRSSRVLVLAINMLLLGLAVHPLCPAQLLVQHLFELTMVTGRSHCHTPRHCSLSRSTEMDFFKKAFGVPTVGEKMQEHKAFRERLEKLGQKGTDAYYRSLWKEAKYGAYGENHGMETRVDPLTRQFVFGQANGGADYKGNPTVLDYAKKAKITL